MTGPSAFQILTRHFLRRFLENDLISPEADRSHLLAVIGAALFSTTVFVTMMMSCFKYVVGFYTPGQAAVASLDDKFFYISLSMLCLALLAVAQWDALVVDARDAAILDPLPVRPVVIRRAKLAAVALFGCAAAAIVNLAPTVIFPLLLLVKQRVGLGAAVLIIATHAFVTLAAAAFGYLAVVSLRETLSALLGGRLFSRVSPWVQGTLIVALGTALLLLPAASTRIERTRLDDPTFIHSPPAWFLGVYEQLSGHVLIDAPRSHLPARLQRADAPATSAYRRHRSEFGDLTRRAAVRSGMLTLLAITAYLLNAGRRPTAILPVPQAGRRRWFAGFLGRVPRLQRPSVAAGFCFTLAALGRSNTHRLTIACCGAAGLALSLVALSGIDVQELASTGRATPRLLIVQPFLAGMLLVGFRHVIRVPAELRANWAVQLAWRNRDREFISGAKRAAAVGLLLPALAAVFVLDTFVISAWFAFQHALLGLAGGIVLLEALMLGYDKVPFTCSYVPSENMKALGPIYFFLFMLGASMFAQKESAALNSGDLTTILVTLVVVFAGLRAVGLTRHRLAPVDFDEAPARTQNLGLHT